MKNVITEPLHVAPRRAIEQKNKEQQMKNEGGTGVEQSEQCILHTVITRAVLCLT